MKVRFSLLAALLLMTGAMTACGKAQTARAATDTARVSSEEAIPMPEVPDDIFDPVERADYILLHYWEGLDFRDPRARDAKFIEAAFAPFAEQYKYASSQGAAEATATLLNNLEGYPEVYRLMAQTARKQLYTRGAPNYNEPAFTLWLRELVVSPHISDADRTRYKYLLEAAEKNAPGKKASDFSFVDRSGRPHSLLSLPAAQYTLLIFYDPDCETCHDIINTVRNDTKLMGPVNAGQVRVLLVDVADDKEAFASDASALPAKWTVGFDTSSITDSEIYVFDTTPTIYLLDRDYRVILKDATIDELKSYARSVTAP